MNDERLQKIVDRIMRGELDDELAAAQRDQEDSTKPSVEIEIDDNIVQEINRLMEKRNYSFEAFVGVLAYEYLISEDQEEH